MAFAAARIIKDKKDQQEMKWSKSPDGVNISRTGRKVDRQVRNHFRENLLHNFPNFFSFFIFEINKGTLREINILKSYNI